MYILFLITGFYKARLKILLPALLIAVIFGGITYLAGRGVNSALSIALRFAAVFEAVIPGMSIRPVDLTRNLNELHIPRGITLGMLIALNFTPLLAAEVRQIREAMKTRGAGSIFNLKIFYRAFLIPLIMRLVNISDTLSLSVETRGFTLESSDCSVYKRVKPGVKDFAVLILSAAIGAGAVII